MGAIYELALREMYPPILLFEQIKGYPENFKIVMNVRFSRMFVGELNLDAVKARRQQRKWEAEPIPPQYVDSGPILSNVVRKDDVNVQAFPAGYWHAGDGGPYIGTECLVITKGPRQRLDQCRHLPRPGPRSQNPLDFLRAGQARPHHPREILGAGRGVPDGRRGGPGARPRRCRANGVALRRIGARHRRRPARRAGARHQGRIDRPAYSGRRRACLRGLPTLDRRGLTHRGAVCRMDRILRLRPPSRAGVSR